MPDNRQFLGHAPSYQQTRDYTIAGAWGVGNTITFPIDNIDFTVTIGALVTAAQVATTVKEAWQNETLADVSASAVPTVTGDSGEGGGAKYIPQHAEVTATNPSAGIVRLTVTTAGRSVNIGVPVVVSGSGGTVTPGTLTAATGKEWLNNADNFDPNGNLVTGDSLTLSFGAQAIREGLDLTPKQLLVVTKYAAFTANVGLPRINKDNESRTYGEYRVMAPTTVHDAGVGLTTFNLELGEGQGSSLFRWDCTNGKFVANVHGKGQRIDNVPCINIIGTHAQNVMNNYNGDVGVGLYPDEPTTLLELNHGNGDGTQALTYCGAAADLTNCTIVINGGTITTNSALCTATGTCLMLAGEHFHLAGDIEDVTIAGGNWRQRCGGAIDGTLTIMAGAQFDLSQNFDTLTPAAVIQVYGDGEINDPNGTLALNTDIKVNGDFSTAKLKLGRNVTIRIIARS